MCGSLASKSTEVRFRCQLLSAPGKTRFDLHQQRVIVFGIPQERETLNSGPSERDR